MRHYVSVKIFSLTQIGTLGTVNNFEQILTITSQPLPLKPFEEVSMKRPSNETSQHVYKFDKMHITKITLYDYVKFN